MASSPSLVLFALALVVSCSCQASRNAQAGSIRPAKRLYTSDAERDRVTSLPGWGAVEGIFGGYVTVDEDRGRHLFYTYVESSSSPATDPLLLWLNGGPGCSSVGGGFMSELGPFLPMPGGQTLQANPYSWNRVANVLFVESPAFVGFSYSEDPSDAVVGDGRTAQDMRSFLLGFVQRFPHLATRDLYISGESYAGHYLPTLAWEIVKGNERARAAAGGRRDPAASGYLNLRGIAVGNPWTDAAVDNLGAVDFWWAHALISDKTALGIKTNCDFSRVGPLDSHPESSDPHTRAGACDKFCNNAAFELGPINIYHIYADVCTSPATSHATNALAAALTRGSVANATGLPASLLGVAAATASDTLRRRGRLAHVRVAWDLDPDADAGSTTYDPCTDDETSTYLNLPEVQRALHANVSGDLPGPWADCTREISYSREDLLSSMLPVWQQLIATPGLRFIVYSGDVDGIVPVVGTRRWVAALGLPEATRWRPWQSGHADQVGGYTIGYSTGNHKHAKEARESGAAQADFVFATVRNAGHMVPYVQPQRALHLIARFLTNQPL